MIIIRRWITKKPEDTFLLKLVVSKVYLQTLSFTIGCEILDITNWMHRTVEQVEKRRDPVYKKIKLLLY